MISEDQRKQLNEKADAVFSSFFGEPLDSDTLRKIEKALAVELSGIVGEHILVSCYPASLDRDRGDILGTVAVKEWSSETGYSYINMYRLTYAVDSKGD